MHMHTIVSLNKSRKKNAKYRLYKEQRKLIFLNFEENHVTEIIQDKSN